MNASVVLWVYPCYMTSDMRIILSTFLIAAVTAACAIAEPKMLYENNFENAEVGKLPQDPTMMVLDGNFAVRQDGTNRVLELPGSPLESYGVLFGPAQKEGAAVIARILGTGKGRRFPTFAVGLNGAAGWRLQVSPGKKQLELYKGDTRKEGVPYEWQSGKWTHLRLQVRKVKDGEWKVEGRAWTGGSPEPDGWTISCSESEEPRPGKAGAFGSPFAGTPISYDDLKVFTLD